MPCDSWRVASLHAHRSRRGSWRTSTFEQQHHQAHRLRVGSRQHSGTARIALLLLLLTNLEFRVALTALHMASAISSNLHSLLHIIVDRVARCILVIYTHLLFVVLSNPQVNLTCTERTVLAAEVALAAKRHLALLALPVVGSSGVKKVASLKSLKHCQLASATTSSSTRTTSRFPRQGLSLFWKPKSMTCTGGMFLSHYGTCRHRLYSHTIRIRHLPKVDLAPQGLLELITGPNTSLSHTRVTFLPLRPCGTPVVTAVVVHHHPSCLFVLWSTNLKGIKRLPEALASCPGRSNWPHHP